MSVVINHSEWLDVAVKAPNIEQQMWCSQRVEPTLSLQFSELYYIIKVKQQKRQTLVQMLYSHHNAAETEKSISIAQGMKEFVQFSH